MYIDTKKIIIGTFSLLFLLVLVALFFDVALAAGLCFIAFLAVIVCLLFVFKNLDNRFIYVIFLGSLLIHLAVVIFLFYSHFQPFSKGVGDYTIYDSEARNLAMNFSNGNFVLKGISLTTYFPVLIGIIYTIILPKMIVGVLFAAFLGAITSLFVFLTSKKLGATDWWAFAIAAIVNFYPSYIFYGSLLLRDVVIIPLAIIALFLLVNLAEKFSWWKFLVLYVILGAEIHLRVYVGYSIIIVFLVSFLLIVKLGLKRKLIYFAIIIPLLGFLPQISGYGYYGSSFLRQYLNPKTIVVYQNLYNPESPLSLSPNIPTTPPVTATTPPVTATTPPVTASTPPVTASTPPVTASTPPVTASTPPVTASTPSVTPAAPNNNPVEILPSASIGLDSSFVVNIDQRNSVTIAISYLKYFCYILLGPLPWQMKSARHYFALLETIPWYVLLFFVSKGIIFCVKHKNKNVIPLLIFALLILGSLTVYISNFGIITRIRIPAVISLLCLAPLAFIKEDKKENYVRYSGNY